MSIPSKGATKIIAAPVVDFTVLDGLLAELGESGVALRRTLLDTYLEDGQLRMGQLATAVEHHDYVTVANVAHTLKSSSALLGVLPLADLLQQTEDAARADTTRVARLADLADAEYRRAAQVIGALLGTLPDSSAASAWAGTP